MKDLNTYLVLLVVGLCCSPCCTDAATIDNSCNSNRLPTSLKPINYNLYIFTNKYYNSDFIGQVTIRFSVLEDTNKITLHSKNIDIYEHRIELMTNKSEKKMDCVLNVTYDLEHDFFIIHLNETLQKGGIFMLYLEFFKELSETLPDYHIGSYLVGATNETSWPIARAAFPCWDEPEYKAKFAISILHCKNFTALSNMALEREHDAGDGYVWSIFQESVRMSPYMVAFSVNDLKPIVSKANNNTVFRTWARLEAIDQCNYASIVGPRVLKFYEELFGIKFALKKVDQIALSDFNGNAKESWGLVTYPESALLFDPRLSSNTDKLRIAQTIAYIFAQQWLGNLVTMKSRSDFWLSKGISIYVSSLGVERLLPEWKSYNEGSLENILYILRNDAQLSSHPISQEMLSTSQIGEQFDSISYKKASLLFRMLHSVLGKQAFIDGVSDYLKDHEYANAQPDDLWDIFTAKARLSNRIPQRYDIKTIMNPWTSQSGIPLVKVTRDYENGSIIISQQRFLDNQTLTEQQLETEKCWWIPLSYTTSSNMSFQSIRPRKWLECDTTGKSKNLKLYNITARWVLFNIQLSSVYRVWYDESNWLALTEAIKGTNYSQFHIMNRVQLLDDAISLAFRGYLHCDYVFNLLEYLLYEREYLPWKTASEALSRFETLLKPFPLIFKKYMRYISYIMQPVYNYLNGVNATDLKESPSFTQTMLKSVIADWACRLNIGDCVENSLAYFKKWKLSENATINNTIPVDLIPTVSCTAISYGNEDNWLFLLQIYNESKVTTGKLNLVTSMACSRNTTILSQYLDLIYNTPGFISKQDATSAFISMARNEAGFPIALKFFIQNVDELNSYYGPYSYDLGTLLSSLAGQITSTEDGAELIFLIESKKDYLRISETIAQSAIETINSNLKWIYLNVKDTNSNLHDCINSAQLLKETDLL